MNVLLDACFLIGLYDEADQHHKKSKILFADMFDTKATDVAVILWPALYEAVSTRLVRHRRRTLEMKRDWRRLESTKNLIFMDDAPYRLEALDLCFRELDRVPRSYRALSLTDRVLRGVLADTSVDVDALLTFNEGDFADVCTKFGREIVN